MLKSRFARLTLALVVAAGAASAAANVLVVRATGPSAKSYPAGRSLPDNARITLRPGDTVVVLGANGTRTFRGPGNFSPSAQVVAAARTVTTAGGRRARIGAVRNAGILPIAPSTIWQIDVAQSSTFCRAGSEPLVLWRADTSRSANLTIEGPAGVTRELLWPAGAATVAWPTDLPVVDATDYQLRVTGAPTPARVRFRTLNPVPADMPGVAAALISNGCSEQLDLLVDSTAEAGS